MRTRAGLALSLGLALSFGCQRPTDRLRGERIPSGSGWQCWMGRCDRVCRGMPGPPDDHGFAPEPSCNRLPRAFCTTFSLGVDAHWECFETRESCQGNQRHYEAEAKRGGDYSAVAPCTEIP